MSENKPQHKFILIGASRGLGWATYLQLAEKYPQAHFLLVSRKINNRKAELRNNTETYVFDLAKVRDNEEYQDGHKIEHLNDLVTEIERFDPTEIIYFAGGGPYGLFESKKWTDHLWAMRVTFLTPAFLIHTLLSKNSTARLRKFICIGSAIAESSPDPMAASYCAAKHALKGFIDTLTLESAKESVKRFEVRLFSPGYIDTDMLPQQSWPRQQGLVEAAENVAHKLINFMN